MNTLRRLVPFARRNLASRGHSAGQWPNGSFWSEGTQTGVKGFLFGELPPPPGQTRKWEYWEAPWYTIWGLASVGFVVMIWGKPAEAYSIKFWARPRAYKELDEDMKMFDKLQQRPDLLWKLQVMCRSLGMIEEEAYDLVFMRREFKTLKAIHDGTVPPGFQELFEELEKDDA